MAPYPLTLLRSIPYPLQRYWIGLKTPHGSFDAGIFSSTAVPEYSIQVAENQGWRWLPEYFAYHARCPVCSERIEYRGFENVEGRAELGDVLVSIFNKHVLSCGPGERPDNIELGQE